MKLRTPIRYPKSFFKLLAAGFLLAVLPLVAGLLVNMVAIQRLAAQSQRAVYDAARVVHASRELSETAMSLERAALQGIVLQDTSMWESYLALHRRFVEAGAKVIDISPNSPIRAAMFRAASPSAASSLSLSGSLTISFTPSRLSRTGKPIRVFTRPYAPAD